MAKIEQEVKEMKTAITELEGKIDKLQFFLVQIMNKVSEEGDQVSSGSTTGTAPGGAISVDITPLEERLEQLSKTMVSKADLEPITQALNSMHDDRVKEAEDTIDNVTVLLEKGLALTELTASLKEIEAHLQELIAPPK
ncbi:MAG: hypothetical protein GNW80_14940 [Asgard group archaeon]|nr:hypothetical protein [Asgard group archaeon]